VSSIRSLAMITLLTGVGIFLYFKLNEVPPVVPAEVEGFELGAIQFGEQASAPSAAPQFGATSPDAAMPSAALPSDTAPAFNPIAAAAPTAQPAPAWNDTQASNPPNALAPPPITMPTDKAPTLGESAESNAAIVAAPNLPPMPTLPPSVPQTADSEEMPHVTSLPTEQAPPTTPPIAVTPQEPSSLFSATRLAAEAALDRGELSQALLLLSDWYDDPSLADSELQEVNNLLRQLAGSVIYSTEHRLEPPYMVQAGEQLEDIAQKYQVPWQLLAKINGISPSDQLQPGQKLKVMRGPFSALIDLGRRKMILMLGRRYAGQFSLEIDPSSTVEEGHWTVNQKLLTPGNVGAAGSPPGSATEERSLMLSRPDGSTKQLAILRGSNATTLAEPAGRVLRLSPQEVGDVYDILSLGSRVVIRR